MEPLIKLILYSKVVINKYNVKIPGNNNDISDFAQILLYTKLQKLFKNLSLDS